MIMVGVHADVGGDFHRFAGDFLCVVERCISHRDTADEHGFETRNGRQRAGSADLDVDVVDDGGGLLGGKFMRDRPAWRLRRRR